MTDRQKYCPPQCEVEEIELEGVIAASGIPDLGDGGELI